MERAGCGELEGSDLCFEARAVRAHHSVGPSHGTERGRQWAPRGVLEGVSGTDLRLFAHDPVAADFFDEKWGVK